MSKLNDLSSDILCHIFSTYVILPYLSKSIHKTCKNSSIYKYYTNRYRYCTIVNFLENLGKKYHNLLKEEHINMCNLDRYNGSKFSKEFYDSLIDKYYQYHNGYSWSYIPMKYLEEYKDKYKIANLYYLFNKFNTTYSLSEEEYILLLEDYDIATRLDIHKIPSNHFTIKIAEIIVTTIPCYIKSIPERLLTEDICNKAIFIGKVILRSIPTKYFTYGICKQGLLNCCFDLEFIKNHRYDLYNKYHVEFKMIASIGDGILLKNTLNNLQYEDKMIEYYDEVLNKIEIMIDIKYNNVNYVKGLFAATMIKAKPELMTYEMCKLALSLNGQMIKHIQAWKPCILDEDLYDIATTNNSATIKYVPEEYITEDMVLRYINSGGFDLDKFNLLPNSILTSNVYRKLIKRHFYCIKYIPNNILSKEECYKINPSCAYYLGEEYIKRFIQEYDL